MKIIRGIIVRQKKNFFLKKKGAKLIKSDGLKILVITRKKKNYISRFDLINLFPSSIKLYLQRLYNTERKLKTIESR